MELEDDTVASGPRVVDHFLWHHGVAAGRKRRAARIGRLLAHSDVQRPGEDGHVLKNGVPVRRYPVVWRELEAQGERDGLGRVAFEQRELGPAGQGWRAVRPADARRMDNDRTGRWSCGRLRARPRRESGSAHDGGDRDHVVLHADLLRALGARHKGLPQAGAGCTIGPIRVIDLIDRVYPMVKPGLTVHRLELFLAVLDHGGVGRAAQACHISQPAVSEHLRGLEAHFGVRLVERHGQRVRPTAAARVVEPYARQALALLRTAEQAAGDVRGLRAGSLTIGASTTPGTYLLPAALGRFHAAYPGITLRLEISDTREIERSVAVGQLELGVIGEAPLVPALTAEPWVKDELVLIVPRGHPFARRRAVTAHAIAGESYIAREEGSSTRGVAERYLARLGVTLTPAMELGSTEARSEEHTSELQSPCNLVCRLLL